MLLFLSGSDSELRDSEPVDLDPVRLHDVDSVCFQLTAAAAARLFIILHLDYWLRVLNRSVLHTVQQQL